MKHKKQKPETTPEEDAMNRFMCDTYNRIAFPHAMNFIADRLEALGKHETAAEYRKAAAGPYLGQDFLVRVTKHIAAIDKSLIYTDIELPPR